MYCTNCGQKTDQKICLHCGVKRNTTHHYCQWCGAPIKEYAVICVSCQKPVKPKQSMQLLRFLENITIIFCVFFANSAFLVKAYFSGELFLIAAVLLLPPMKKMLFDSIPNSRKKVIYGAAQYTAVAVLCIAGFVTYTKAQLPEIKVYRNAETISNEKTFLENDFSTEGDTEKIIKIVLDFSKESISVVWSEMNSP